MELNPSMTWRLKVISKYIMLFWKNVGIWILSWLLKLSAIYYPSWSNNFIPKKTSLNILLKKISMLLIQT
jgi:hypothetical protein